MRILRVLWLVVLASMLAPALVWGQLAGFGTITGTVSDPSKAVVAGAQVTITDVATGSYQGQPTNATGRFVFANIKPATYDVSVTMKGFRKLVLPAQVVTVGSQLNLDLTLEVGAAVQTVEVKAAAGAELQTLNSTMGMTVAGDSIMNLPSANRDATSLMLYQPMTAPTFDGTEGNTAGGQIAGSMSDQNTFLLDGGNATSDLEGDNNYVASNRQYVGPQAAIPTPIESIQEFKIDTNNMTSDFASSAGGEIQMVTKRGTNAYHGSGYEFFQADWLDADTWNNNRYGIALPKNHQNRFGGAFGGPLPIPSILGGKTYFYANYEGRRFKNASSMYERQVPSDMLRQGIVQVRDDALNVQAYNLKTATNCGPSANLPCDPRGIGIAPDIQKLWTQYMPEPNDTLHYGDLLNTYGYYTGYTLPVKEDFIVGRVDHDFGSKWRWMASYRYYRDVQPSTNQIDIGGFLPGDVKGQADVVSSNPLHPDYFVTGLTGNITPTVTNQFHLSYLRNDWNWIRAGVANGVWQSVFGVPGGLEVGGETTNPLGPFNFDTQNARFRTWDGHDWNYIDQLSWLKGTHFLQFGGTFTHWWDNHVRPDNVTGELTELVYQIIKGGGLLMDPTWQPQYCSGALTTGCMNSSAWLGTWNGLYAESLGFVGQSQQVITRGGSDLHTLGLPYLQDHSITNQYSINFADAWKIRPNITLNYGLEYGVQMPPYELNGVQDIPVDQAGNEVLFNNYMTTKYANALKGVVYNPVIGFDPIRAVGGSPKYPFAPYYGALAPRVSIAWSPTFDTGILNKLFGNKKSVIRGGFARLYDRNNAVNLVLTPLLGYGFGQPLKCLGGVGVGFTGYPAGSCTNEVNATNPTNGFRIGVDGNVAPFAPIAPTLPTPAEPGINAPAAGALFALDPGWRPGVDDEINVSFQRELRGGFIVEGAYVGKWIRHIYLGEDTNNVPYMMTVGGQSLASAFTNMYLAFHNGATAATMPAQPFFETALAGSPFCKGYSSCTVAVATTEGPSGTGNITALPGAQQYANWGDSLTGLFADLDSECSGPCWTGLGTNPPGGSQAVLPQTTQQYSFINEGATRGFGSYQAFVASVQKRAGHGLMLNANFTIGHSLGMPAINDEFVEDAPNNSYNLNYDYGPSLWDRRYTLNLMGTYMMPFGKGQRWLSHSGLLDRFVGGWQVAPLFTWATGYPLEAYTGSCGEISEINIPWCAGIVPTINIHALGSLDHTGIMTPNPTSTSPNGNPLCVACGGNNIPSLGETGIQRNIFANPIAVYNAMTPFLIGQDTDAYDQGPFYGQTRWLLDLSVLKTTKITERVGFTLSLQMYNALNHMMWGDPGFNLMGPTGFGVIGGQYGPNRTMELGLRVFF